MAKKGTPDVIQELQRVVDSAPMNVNRAFDKGTTFATPELVAIDTNNPKLNAQHYMYAPNSIWRRFLRVEVSVLEEFSNEGAIDHEKSARAAENGSMILDRYTFKAMECVPKGKKAEWKMLGSNLSIYQFVKFFASYIKMTRAKRELTLNLNYDWIEETLQEDDDDDVFIDDVDGAINAIDPSQEFVQFESKSVDSADEKAETAIHDFDTWSDVDSDCSSESLSVGSVSDEDDDLFQWKEDTWYDKTWKTITDCGSLLLMFIATLLITAEPSGNWRGPYYLFNLYMMWTSPLLFCTLSAFTSTCRILYTDGFLGPFIRKYYKITTPSSLIKKRLSYRLFGVTFNPYTDDGWANIWLTIVTVYGCLGAFSVSKRLYNKYVRPRAVAESRDKEGRSYEEDVGVPVQSFKTKFSERWVTPTEIKASPSTQPLRTFYNTITKHLYKVSVDTEFGGMNVYAQGIKGNAFIINKHALQGASSADITLHVKSGAGILTKCHVRNFEDVTDDVVMFVFKNRQVTDIIKHFGVCSGTQYIHGIFSGKEVVIVSGEDGRSATDPKGNSFVVQNYLGYKCSAHSTGFCGLPIVGRVGSNKSAILGIHFGASHGTDCCFGSQITPAQLDSAYERVTRCSPYPEVHSEGEFRECEMPVVKSPMRYEEFEGLFYCGKLPGKVMLNKKANMSRRMFVEFEEVAKKHTSLRKTKDFGIPMMRPCMRNGEYVSLTNIWLRKAACIPPTLDESIMERSIKDVLDFIMPQIDDVPIYTINMEMAINGDIEDEYFRRMNLSTAAGHGCPGKKIDYMKLISEENGYPIYMPTEELQLAIEEAFEILESGKSLRSIFDANPKVEAREMEKCLSGKTRYYMVVQIVLLILTRMYLGRFYSTMVSHAHAFCAALGIDMHRDAHKLVTKLSRFSPLIMEGDYSGYDVSNPIDIAMGANAIVHEVCKRKGYSDEELFIVRGLLTENVYPHVQINQDVIMKPGLQPSGKYATAEDNSLRGLLMLVYAWNADPKTSHCNFFDYNLPVIYGDDMLNAVKPTMADYFNNLTYAKAVKDHYGMKFTSAAKDGSLDKFVSIETMSFLKRKFHQDAKGKWYARLDCNSLFKTMQWRVDSPTESSAEQDFSAACSVLYELYFHLNRDEYDALRQYFVNKFSECGYPHDKFHVLKTYDDHVRDFGGIAAESFDNTRAQNQIDMLVVVMEDFQFFDDMMFELYGVRYEEVDRGDEMPPWISEDDEEFVELVREMHTLLIYRNYLERNLRIYAQSESVEQKTGYQEELNTEVTLTDNFGLSEEKLDLGNPLLLDSGQYSTSMSDFLGRPVSIFVDEISVGAGFDQVINPWALWSSEPSVRAKLRNFAYFKGNLCLRIAVSGTPFHVGRLMFSYQPYGDYNDCLGQIVLADSTNPLFRPIYLAYLSQSEWCKILPVGENKPLMMELPFISPKTMFRTFNWSPFATSSGTTFLDFERAGTLHIETMASLDAQSASADPISIQIYAWATDYGLGVPTATQLDIVTEGEYVTGPVEKFFSGAAHVSAALSSVPYVAPFARASEMISNGFGALASIMGWSRPAVVSEPVLVKNRPYANGAQSIGSETLKRITYDPKQEIAICPQLVASDGDDMIIRDMAGRESYFTTFEWDSSDSILSSPIWLTRVTPQLVTKVMPSTVDNVLPTAMAYVAQPFHYWRGDIILRFDVVVSAYHRGKLGFYYEPNVSQAAIINSSLSLNKQFFHVMDLQETQSVEFCINWAQPWDWLKLKASGDLIGEYGLVIDDMNPDYCNGFVGVVPITRLTSPLGGSVDVLVTGRCENLRVAFADSVQLPTERIFTEGLSVDPVTCVDLVDLKIDDSHISECHFGEEIFSFRSLIKRYVTVDAQEHIGAGGNVIVYDRENLPTPRPFIGSGFSGPSADVLGYLMYAFVGVKGEMRYRVRIYDDERGRHDEETAVVVTLNTISNVANVNNLTEATGTSNRNVRGSVVFIPHTNGGVEYSVPFYSANNFVFAFNDLKTGSTTDGVMEDFYNRQHNVRRDVGDTTGRTFRIVVDYAAGEDFALMRFQGAPFYSVP
jgi:hypothetical protein